MYVVTGKGIVCTVPVIPAKAGIHRRRQPADSRYIAGWRQPPSWGFSRRGRSCVPLCGMTGGTTKQIAIFWLAGDILVTSGNKT
jgi:hypothetical protein